MPVQFDAAGEPVKGLGQSTPGGFTGGGGNGPPGGVFSGGGGPGGFNVSRNLLSGSLLDNSPASVMRRKFYSQAGRPPGNGGQLSTSPAAGYASGGPVAQPSDTTPAMLTPGEFVVNKQAASDPNNAALLQQMNGGGGQGGSPGLSREALVELLMVLLGGQGGESDMAQMCNGGKVPGYGLGGFIGSLLGAASLIPSPVSPWLKAGAMASGAADSQFGRDPQQDEQASNQAIMAYLNDRARHSTPGYAFGGPVGIRPSWAGGSGNMSQPGRMPLAALGQGQAQGQGVPPPSGPAPAGNPIDPSYGAGSAGYQQYNAPDPSVLAAMNEAGSRDANAYAGGVFNQAQLMGADPAQQAAYKLQALAGASTGSANALSKYRTDQATSELSRKRQIEDYNSQLAAKYEQQRRDAMEQERLKRIH